MLEALRRLDGGVTKRASAAALNLGIIGTLLLGAAVCCVLLPAWNTFMIPGIVIGMLGIVGIVMAYPCYNRVAAIGREKAAPEILRLTEELMKQQKKQWKSNEIL